MIKKCIVQGCENMAEDTHNGITTAPFCDHHLETECIQSEDGEIWWDTGRSSDLWPLLCEHRGEDGERDCENSPTHVVPNIFEGIPPFVFCSEHYRSRPACSECGNTDVVSAVDTDSWTQWFCAEDTEAHRKWLRDWAAKPKEERDRVAREHRAANPDPIPAP